ncbi:hypothetical protein [Hydrogenophaga sp.]|uniref:baeRF3 domain-containing protein n=1 Tax=Hydrogenophaga sp. TaxID=1904254 RepID=UPI00271DC5E9|nr:hypothetical protein [Hydrogenophaga sp.]MDO9507018.1 hypothetical protein [Hydrogenophaga sp.]
MHPLTPESLKELAQLATAPCLSLYQPTHRSHPDNRQDPIRFRKNVETLGASLRLVHPDADVQALLAPFHQLADNEDFWNHTLDGLAVLGCAGVFRVFVLPRTLPELVLAADSFHTKPLRRFLQSVDRFQVLCLSRDKASLFEGNRHGLAEVDLAAPVPRTSSEALGDQLTEPHQTVSSRGGIGQGSSPLVHSSGGKKDEVDLDADRYFRALDRAIFEHCSKPGGLPLLLAALPEHHHRFQQASHNTFLLPEGLEINPEALDIHALSQSAWDVVQPQYLARQQAWGEDFSTARGKGLGSDDLNEVAKAAAEGRVASLLIEDERQIAGRLDSDTGRVDSAELVDPTVDDVLDDIGELVERMGGEVRVIGSARMPTTTGLAATFRH